MANESEVIRHQMDETRTNLTDKIEKLENKVVQTVEGATAAVADTVDTVKDVVAETVQTVKESVTETVSSVKETFDICHQVQVRPWTMMAGAAVLGFVGGHLLKRSRRSTTPGDALLGVPLESRHTTGNGVRFRTDADLIYGAGRDQTDSPAPTASSSAEPGWLSQFGEAFHEEIQRAKGLALGTLLGVFRDTITKAVPGNLEDKVAELIDGITTKLGGQPIHGILPNTPEATRSAAHVPDRTSRFSTMS